MYYSSKGTTEYLHSIEEWLPNHDEDVLISKIYKYLKLSEKNKKFTVENKVNSEDNETLMFNLVKK